VSKRKVVNPLGKWCGVPCMECDEWFKCYKRRDDIPVDPPDDKQYTERDVLEDDYSEDSVP